MKILHLHLKKKWFDMIKEGKKHEEHREVTDFWTKRIKNRKYDQVWIHWGYPKKGTEDRTVKFHYAGYTIKDVVHPDTGKQCHQYLISLHKPVNIYGYCPICGAEGDRRERRTNGYTFCVEGHKWLNTQSS